MVLDFSFEKPRSGFKPMAVPLNGPQLPATFHTLLAHSPLEKMEFANKLVAAAAKAANNETVINVCLVGSFLALCVRSVNQGKDIEALEAEKKSLIQSNKALKKTLWDWKQQLFAEAATDSALVPLARLKAIYGEAPAPLTGDVVKEDAKSPAPKLMI